MDSNTVKATVFMVRIQDAINARDRDDDGVDIVLGNVGSFAEDLCKAYTANGNVLTLEVVFGNKYCFAWGETPEKHKAWVDAR